MFLLNSIGGGRYLTIGTLFHRAIEIGYQFYDDNYFDLSLSYVTKGPHSGLKFSISFFKLFFECNLYNTKQWEPKELIVEEVDQEIPSKLDEEEIDPTTLPGTLLPDLEGKDEYSETHTFIPSVTPGGDDVIMQEVQATEIKVMPSSKVTLGSLAEQEFAEYGSIALRRWVGQEVGTDELLDGSKSLKLYSTVLIRAIDGGFHFLKLCCDDDGWYVNHPKTLEFINVTFDTKRKLWVIDQTF